MQRRQFLLASAAVSASTIVGSVLSLPALAVQPSLPLPVLLRLLPEAGRFMPFVPSMALTPAAGLRLSLHSFHPAAGSALSALRVDALFGDAASPWRFQAWHYARGDALGSSRGNGFDLGEGGFQGLALHPQYDQGADAGELRCGPGLLDGTALTPGRYLLLVDARHAPLAGLPFSGDWNRPLGEIDAYDHFAVGVEPVTASPDLSLREDLACLADCTA